MSFEYVEVATYTYDAWGEKLHILDSDGNEITSSSNIAIINPLRYRGYYYDTETGWYYLQSRYYDPANHRFINADTYASTDSTDAISCNMFAYCENNPVNLIDNSGHAGELTAGWAGGMWWLPFIDGPIPVGDIIYGAGCLVCGIVDLVDYVGIDTIVQLFSSMPDVAASHIILESHKKVKNLFIAPRARQILHETAQHAFARCEGAQNTGFLMKPFNQESVLGSMMLQ